MCTVFFSRNDFRQAMQDPHTSFRAHAMCRKLTGASSMHPIHGKPGCSRPSHWYGAFYWAACAFTTKNRTDATINWYKRCFAREINGHPGTPEGDRLRGPWLKVWNMAVAKCRKLWREARKLPNSNLW